MDRAAELEAMAGGARTADARAALLRLAVRFRDFAAHRAAAKGAPILQHPADLACLSGGYEQLNIFGTRTGTTAHLEQGARLPAAPRGFTWRLAKSVTATPP